MSKAIEIASPDSMEQRFNRLWHLVGNTPMVEISFSYKSQGSADAGVDDRVVGSEGLNGLLAQRRRKISRVFKHGVGFDFLKIFASVKGEVGKY